MIDLSETENYPKTPHYCFLVLHPSLPEKVKVEYNGDWHKGGTLEVIHFQLYSHCVSSTGYRSHFTYRPVLEEFGEASPA